MAAAMLAFSGMLDGNSGREALENGLIHYFENVLVVRSARDMPEALEEEDMPEARAIGSEREAVRSSAAARSRGTMRDDLFMQKEKKEESAAAKEWDEKRASRSELSIKNGDEGSTGHQKQLEELKESLAQIAAARGESGERQTHNKQQPRKLSPKEEQLINEIISQYLS